MYESSRSPIEALAFEYMQRGYLWCDPFIVGYEFAPVPPMGVNVPQSRLLDTDSDFVCQQLNLETDDNSNALFAMRIQWIDGGSGRMLTNEPIHVNCMTGVNRYNGAQPFTLPMAKFFRGGSTVTFQLTNFTTYEPTVNLAMVGFKIYYSQGVDRVKLFRVL